MVVGIGFTLLAIHCIFFYLEPEESNDKRTPEGQ